MTGRDAIYNACDVSMVTCPVPAVTKNVCQPHRQERAGAPPHAPQSRTGHMHAARHTPHDIGHMAVASVWHPSYVELLQSGNVGVVTKLDDR